MDHDNITLKKFYLENKKDKFEEINFQSQEKERNMTLKNNKLNANRELYKSCPIKTKNKKEIDRSIKSNDRYDISDLSINQKFNSSNYLNNANPTFKNFILDNTQNKEDSDLLNDDSNLNDDIKYNTPKFFMNNIKKVQFFKHKKHKTSTDLNNLLEENTENPSNKNITNNKNEATNDSNVRKYSFFYNFRNQSNLVKDLKLIVKRLNFKEEIEKFSGLKISKNILERINMPPFRNVQIERKITEELNHNMHSDKNLDEPLRINNIQILSFLIVLILLFVVAILLIVFLDI